VPYPMPRWLQSYFRDWPGDTSGMFGSKEAGLARQRALPLLEHGRR
jgi:hypothetical protein